MGIWRSLKMGFQLYKQSGLTEDIQKLMGLLEYPMTIHYLYYLRNTVIVSFRKQMEIFQ